MHLATAWHKIQGDVEGDYAGLCVVAAKSADNAAHIACVLHVLKHGAYGRIEADTMQSAVNIPQWHLDEAHPVCYFRPASP